MHRSQILIRRLQATVQQCTFSRLFKFAGNCICIVRLRCGSSKLNPTFSSLISWLAVIDTLFLVFISLTFSLPSLSDEYKKWIFPVLLPSTLPLTSVFLSGNDIQLLVFVKSSDQSVLCNAMVFIIFSDTGVSVVIFSESLHGSRNLHREIFTTQSS